MRSVYVLPGSLPGWVEGLGFRGLRVEGLGV